MTLTREAMRSFPRGESNPMPRPKRNLIVAGSLLLLVVTAEVALNLLRPPLARVQIVNEGASAIEDLQVVYGGQEVGVARIGPGESARLTFAGWRSRDLKLRFQQPDNALTGFDVAEFDPPALSRDGMKLVITVKPNTFERGMEDDAAPSPRGRIVEVLGRWLDRALKTP
jgi:hypothetical protein